MDLDQNRFRYANELYDVWKFEEAAAIYRQLALEGKLHFEALHNLADVWMFAHVKFLNQVLEKFPDSYQALLRKLEFLSRNSQYTMIIQICNDALKQEHYSAHTRTIIKGHRLNACIAAHETTHVVDDFIAVWQSIKVKRGHMKLLEHMLRATNPIFEPTFMSLSDQAIFDDHIKELFRTKADILRLFAKATNTDSD